MVSPMPTESPLASLPAIRSLAGEARRLALRQDAVATTRQLVSWGFSNDRVERRVAAGEWQRLFRGVVALQSGPLSWRQRARGALLYVGRDAALSHRSAAYVREVLPVPGSRIHVSVPHARTVMPQPGLVVHRRRTMPWAGGRLRAVEADEAVIELAALAAFDDELVGLLCDAVRAGVHPKQLLDRAATYQRLGHRPLLVAMLGEVADGIESPLELRYRRDVERAHGLPRPTAQKRERVGGRWIRADRVYDELRVRIELDGQLAHPFGTTDDDVWRDNAVLLATGDVTLRYRWRHVAVTPCEVAAQVAAALRARGWLGTPCRCGPGCLLATARRPSDRLIPPPWVDFVGPDLTKSTHA
jgi:hypothetical protein